MHEVEAQREDGFFLNDLFANEAPNSRHGNLCELSGVNMKVDDYSIVG